MDMGSELKNMAKYLTGSGLGGWRDGVRQLFDPLSCLSANSGPPQMCMIKYGGRICGVFCTQGVCKQQKLVIVERWLLSVG